MSYASLVCAEVGHAVGAAPYEAEKSVGYTPEEVLAVKAVKRALAAWGVPKDSLGESEMIVFTLNSKCQVEQALKRYRAYLRNLLDEFDLSAEDIWLDDAIAREQLDGQWKFMHAAGKDREGRQIMWLSGGGAGSIQEQRCHIRACCRYFFAVHADIETLRNGVTLVLDASDKASSNCACKLVAL